MLSLFLSRALSLTPPSNLPSLPPSLPYLTQSLSEEDFYYCSYSYSYYYYYYYYLREA